MFFSACDCHIEEYLSMIMFPVLLWKVSFQNHITAISLSIEIDFHSLGEALGPPPVAVRASLTAISFPDQLYQPNNSNQP